jgi:hypothetical protein
MKLKYTLHLGLVIFFHMPNIKTPSFYINYIKMVFDIKFL